MIPDNNSNDIVPINTAKIAAVKKIDAAQATSNLPDDGKKLPPQEKKAEATEENIGDAVKDINKHVQLIQRELQFSVDKDSGQTVIKVIDSKTKELIRQIPGEEALSVAQRISEGDDLEIFNGYT